MWHNILIVVILVALAGTFAGLTLALFGIQLTTLERKIRLGDPSGTESISDQDRRKPPIVQIIVG